MQPQTLQETIDSLHKAASISAIPLETEILPLLDAQGRILAQDYFIKKPLPSFDNSAMDGYALHTKQTAQKLKIQTTIFAGDCEDVILGDFECAKIMTGAKIPQGANCVVPFEEIDGGFSQKDSIQAPKELKASANIRKCGEEIAKGALFAKKGETLSPDFLTLFATQGISHLSVFKPLNILVFASGNELKEPWEEANPYQIHNSNATMVQSILKSYGFQSRYGGILPDDFLSVKNALQSSSDILFTTGGASVGEADFLSQALQELGATFIIKGIEIKPGKPLMVAKIHQKFIIALPGNPLAGNLVLRTFVIPFLRQLAQANAHYPQPIFCKANSALKRKPRPEILLAKIQGEFLDFTKGAKYGSSEVTPMALSNALVIFDSSYTDIQAGDLLKVIPFSLSFSIQRQDFINHSK